MVTRPVFSPRSRSSSRTLMVRIAPVPPIGCPRAIAPPLTLTFAMSKPSSRQHGTAWAAKASLISIMSISLRVFPAFFKELRRRGHGPHAHKVGMDAGHGIAGDLAKGLQTQPIRQRLIHEDQGSSTIAKGESCCPPLPDHLGMQRELVVLRIPSWSPDGWSRPA